MSALEFPSFRKVRAGDYALAHPPEGSVAAKQPERDRLRQQVEEFLKNGGRITQIVNEQIVLPRLTATQLQVIKRLGRAKGGRISEAKLPQPLREHLITLSQYNLINRHGGHCALNDRGKTVYENLLKD